MPRMGNGTNFISPTINRRGEMPAVRLEFMKLKAFIEWLNGTYITETLDFYMPRSLNELQKSRVGSGNYKTLNTRMNH